MKLRNPGKNILNAEVTQISVHGIWLLVQGTEYFLPYQEFPWFKDAVISKVQNVRLTGKSHLYWPDLDVDLEIESLNSLKNYPLIYK